MKSLLQAWRTLLERARRSIEESSVVPGDVRQMAARGEIQTGYGDRTRKSRSSAFTQAQSSTEPGESIQLPDVVSFRYCDVDGEEEQRSASVYKTYFAGGAPYLEAHDLVRSGTRTFRLDRIQGSVTRMDTGEVMAPWEWFCTTSPSPQSRQAFVQGRAGEWQTAVFFAGFHETSRTRLERQAEAAGWDVRGRISDTVDYVVAGPKAGQQQLAQADRLGISVVDEDTFNVLI